MKVQNVSVTFTNFGRTSKEYYYRSKLELEIDDVVVVQSNGFYAVATVVELDVSVGERDSLSWVLAKLDTESFEAQLREEQRRKDVEARLRDRYREVERIKFYESLAASDPIAKNLLEELKELGGVQ